MSISEITIVSWPKNYVKQTIKIMSTKKKYVKIIVNKSLKFRV